MTLHDASGDGTNHLWPICQLTSLLTSDSTYESKKQIPIGQESFCCSFWVIDKERFFKYELA